jgi:hypothetical protein
MKSKSPDRSRERAGRGVMRTNTIIVSMLFLATCFGFAQDQAVPIFRILPADVAQNSIRQFNFSSNCFAVKWTYTEAGAQKMLAFWEANKGQEARIEVGRFVTPLTENTFHPMPPTFTNYVQWKEGWLKHRTDKIFVVNETDAHEILAGLRSQ